MSEIKQELREVLRKLETAKIRQERSNDDCNEWCVDWKDIEIIFDEYGVQL